MSGYTAYIKLISCKEKVSLAPWTVDVTPHEIRATYFSQLTTTTIFLYNLLLMRNTFYFHYYYILIFMDLL